MHPDFCSVAGTLIMLIAQERFVNCMHNAGSTRLLIGLSCLLEIVVTILKPSTPIAERFPVVPCKIYALTLLASARSCSPSLLNVLLALIRYNLRNLFKYQLGPLAQVCVGIFNNDRRVSRTQQAFVGPRMMHVFFSPSKMQLHIYPQ